jgi:hypothetical protein
MSGGFTAAGEHQQQEKDTTTRSISSVRSRRLARTLGHLRRRPQQCGHCGRWKIVGARPLVATRRALVHAQQQQQQQQQQQIKLNEDGSPAGFGALSLEQRYEFDVRGYFVMRGHYTAQEVALFNAGIDELQSIPVAHHDYTSRGLSTPGGISPAAVDDPAAPLWHGRPLRELAVRGVSLLL